MSLYMNLCRDNAKKTVSKIWAVNEGPRKWCQSLQINDGAVTDSPCYRLSKSPEWQKVPIVNMIPHRITSRGRPKCGPHHYHQGEIQAQVLRHSTCSPHDLVFKMSTLKLNGMGSSLGTSLGCRSWKGRIDASGVCIGCKSVPYEGPESERF